MSHIRHFKNLARIIPSKKLGVISISSMNADSIINTLDQFKDFDAVLMTNADVFRYRTDSKLLDYISNDSRIFYNATLGYTNERLLDNYYVLSFPVFFFNRKKTSLVKFDQLPYGYSCLNNRAALHRLVLGYTLWSRDLLNQLIFSQNDWGFINGGYDEEFLKNLKGFNEYKKLLPLKWEDLNREQGNDHDISHSAYSKAYCNIVTETETEFFQFDQTHIPTPVVTEKTYKPFLSGQVPIWVASPGHVNYLKSLGFECMEDLLSNEYDNLDTFAKIQKIVDLVAMGRSFIEEYYHTNWLKIKHNHELVNSDYVDDLIFKNIKNLIL